jgi:hypothetical protein
MKKTKIIVIVFVIFLIPALALAMASNQKSKDTQNQSLKNIKTLEANQSEIGINNLNAEQKGQPALISAEKTEDIGNTDNANGNKNQIQLNKNNEEFGSADAIQRRSRVANAVQAMLQISENNEGVGEQIRIIAQNQNKEMEKIEEDLESVKQRSKFLRFLIGPKYGQIDSIEERLEENSGKLEELIQLKENLSEEDVEVIDVQIQVIKEIKEELLTELDLEKSGFHLFGWLSKLFN